MVSHLECDEVYPDEITLGMICAGDMKGGKDVCNVSKLKLPTEIHFLIGVHLG